MSKTVIITYKTKPEAADENERLVKNVYAQLGAEAPGDFTTRRSGWAME